MNGRVYDPFLARFLSPDPFVQAPDYSQNFNRYSYAWNNPLKYTDPSGEIIIPILIGAAIGIITNGISNSFNNQPFFDGAGKAAFIGAVGGAFSFGIGQSIIGMSGFGKFAFQTIAHGHLGGMMSGISGGTYGQGLLAGAAGSMMGGGAGYLTKKSGTFMQAFATVSSGAVAGGVGAEISGGNFWDGARNGAISAGLNHAMHNVVNKVIWSKFPKLDFNDLNDKERTEHILKAIRFANEQGGIDIDLDIVFKNFEPNSSAAFKSGIINLTIDGNSMPFQLEIGIYNRIGKRFNTVFNFTGGQTVSRDINNVSWTFYKNPGWNWGTTADKFDFIWNHLKY
jgi:hypothetical protein